ncbi:MAG: uracil-DNA glycosylase [Candidatus Omnitrophica bacterium]|nr:uracil-DNA glycosylase [Candidatus Omnitrophota bacterium]
MTDATLTARAVRARLRLEALSGIAWLPVSQPQPVRGTPGTLAEWAAMAAGCRACRLCEGRHSVVFGEGNPAARLLFIGEAPGADEDLQGRPFVGAAGGLLTKMIQALTLSRDDVYIANTVKCRPPGNRVPQPEELAACRRFLEAQVALIRPKVICTLGRTAANALLNCDAPLGALRGLAGTRYQLVPGTGEEIPVIVTYHPAHLLRHPEAKRDAWTDLQRLLPYLHAAP